MIQFYAPDIEISPVLPEGESVHCSRVLRMKQGDEIVVTDGKGHRFVCEVSKPHAVHTEVIIKEKIDIPREHEYFLTLAVAPTKNSDRIEWLVEKAVEIGVDRIVLLKCARSERKIQKTERLMKVMVAAMKQSLSAYLPEIGELVDFKDFVKGEDPETQKFFGYCSENYPRKSFVKECKPGGSVSVMIGPEGDFTSEEVELAVTQGFVPVTFGEKRLRTETAGVCAVTAVQVLNSL